MGTAREPGNLKLDAPQGRTGRGESARPSSDAAAAHGAVSRERLNILLLVCSTNGRSL